MKNSKPSTYVNNKGPRIIYDVNCQQGIGKYYFPLYLLV